MDEKVRESYRRLESCLFHEGRFVTPSFIEVNNMLPTFQAIGLESFLTLDENALDFSGPYFFDALSTEHQYGRSVWGLDPNSSLGKICLGKDVVVISSDKVEGSGDWNSPKFQDTANSGQKKEQCLLEGQVNENALADTGSDINTMPYRIYEQLGREEMKKVDRGITMINHTQAEAMGSSTNISLH
ncbi:hypothetical protein Tco_1548556 [Tanacetum coccineum]